ncbi:hypothetical protein [Fodinicola acaciae]|uniref:hypothetical protein n=1 Tax=Fodinicola acaciae TaxID=2681555 RepID=UPI0013D46EEA|nr:hypothetical protein [Fodinicola acaciae]
MSTPTDRGIAFILENANGTKNVYVAAAAGPDDAPQDVFAMHLATRTVNLGPNVRTVPAGTMRRTTSVVHVSGDNNGTVNLQAHRTDFGPMLAK